MNHKRKMINAAILGVTAMASQGFTQNEYPRGENIPSRASVCPVGPFGATSKPGGQPCQILTDAEKCLAHVKSAISDEGVLQPNVSVSQYEPRIRYCLSVFKQALLPND